MKCSVSYSHVLYRNALYGIHRSGLVSVQMKIEAKKTTKKARKHNNDCRKRTKIEGQSQDNVARSTLNE